MHAYIHTIRMVIIPFNLCKDIKWKLDIYEADGHYTKDFIDSNRDKHVYIDQDLCYYNFYNNFVFKEILLLFLNKYDMI